MLAESSYRHELEADLEPFRGLLLGLFFISVGMTVDLTIIARAWKLLLGALVSLTLIKVSVVYGLVRLLGSNHSTAVRTALLLPQGGEFGFVLFSTAVAAGVMAPEHGTILVALVTLTMAVTPALAALAPRLAGREAERTREESFDGAGGSVLVVGFGRFGQLVCQLLLQRGIDVTIIDNDVEMLEAAERFGFKLYYGDGTRLDVLRAAGADRAALVAICVDKKDAANRILELCGSSFPLAKLYVRAFDRVHALDLIEAGADFQMRETLESAIAFGRAALEELGIPREEVDEVEQDVRRRDHERFVLQLQQNKDPFAGADKLRTRPAPRPEPFIPPQRPAIALNEAPDEVKAHLP